MSLPAAQSAPALSQRYLLWLAHAGLALLVSLLLFRPAESPDNNGDFSYRMVLDLSFRSPRSVTSIQTLDGPLAPLERPVYVGKSIWRSMIWQIGANLLIAGAVVAGGLRLPRTRAWWALALFVVFGVSYPPMGPWCAIVLFGCWAMHSDHRAVKFLCGVAVGILALLSTAHFWFGAGAIALQIPRRVPTSDRGTYFGTGFVAGVLGTWLILEQPLSALAPWLWFGSTRGWTPSAALLTPFTSAAAGWAAITSIAWIAFILIWVLRHRPNSLERSTALLLSWGMLLSWKLIALQPGGTPFLFFTTVTLGGFLLLSFAGWRAAVVLVLGIVGAARQDKMLIGDAVGRINRQLLQNLSEVRHLPELRDRLRREFSGFRESFSLAQSRSATGGAAVGILGNHAVPAILNEFRVIPSSRLGLPSARGEAATSRNARTLLAPDAPAFLLQKLDDEHNFLPGLRDGPAQLALYRAYEFVLTEQGFLLWKKRRESTGAAPELIGQGVLRFGESLALPPTDEAYWLELDCTPNLGGLVVDQLKPLPEPFLRLVDREGHQLRYPLPWRRARAGFLAQPFFRGDLDLLRFQAGEPPPHVGQMIVDPPETAKWAWTSTIRYRLYQLPRLASAQAQNLIEPLLQQFNAFNRIPISVLARFAPAFATIETKPIIFMHPESALELAVTAEDRIVRGSFGIAPGAYAGPGPGVTDGVSFSLEFIPAVGAGKILLRRDLNPVTNSDDRGLQFFNVSLPPSPGGRLLLRTFNLPDGTSSFDWSYWREIEVK